MTEDALLRQAQRGDAGAFAALVEQSSGGLYRFARARLHDDGTAADVAQEAFLRAWRAVASFRGDCSFRSWLYRIAQHLIIDERTRRGRAPVASLDFDEADPAAPALTAGLEAEAERQDVRAALERISPEWTRIHSAAAVRRDRPASARLDPRPPRRRGCRPRAAARGAMPAMRRRGGGVAALFRRRDGAL